MKLRGLVASTEGVMIDSGWSAMVGCEGGGDMSWVTLLSQIHRRVLVLESCKVYWYCSDILIYFSESFCLYGEDPGC